jgi:hypothetical protein
MPGCIQEPQFIYGLYNDNICSSQYAAINGRTVSELKRTQTEAMMAFLKVIY